MKALNWIWLAVIFGVALAASASEIFPADDERVATDIYWSDGDSGRLNGHSFRLANVDSPEKGGIGSIGGAKCELERERAFEAKAFIIELTRRADVRISKSYGDDRYGREVVDLEVNGQDLAEIGLREGVYQPWPHKGQRAMTKKPDWCGRKLASR
ncbi:MAG: hypothetical protein CMK07_03965 [Ponticaulis sp.]|nr:hypothetical protein [Ponticaulis sp.]